MIKGEAAKFPHISVRALEKTWRDQREETALLLSGEDIMWVVGGAVDDRFKLTDATRKVLKVQCEQVDQTV